MLNCQGNYPYHPSYFIVFSTATEAEGSDQLLYLPVNMIAEIEGEEVRGALVQLNLSYLLIVIHHNRIKWSM